MSNNTYWAEAAAHLNFVEDDWTDNFGQGIEEGKVGLATGDVVIEGTLDELYDFAERVIAAVGERLGEEKATCRHCQREIVLRNERWIDPEATGDDSVWRETCDENNEDRIAAHEPDEGLVEDERLIRDGDLIEALTHPQVNDDEGA